MDITIPIGGGQSYLCLDCQHSRRKLYFCSSCKEFYCVGCWSRQLLHRAGRPAAIPHEQVELDLYLRLWKTFNPDPKRQEEQHREDESTTWFAVRRDATNQEKILFDSGRYASLVANGSEGRHLVRFPSIVSFVGQTGAGKSTLLKLLIERQFQQLAGDVDMAACTEIFPTPVVGSFENNNTPTSGDVHLYADPSTYFAESPTFLVDTEGLEGAERSPIAARSKEERQSGRRATGHTRTRYRMNKLQKLRFSRELSRSIGWIDGPEKDKREFAVTHFYPRILYTFSDVIVFVLRNPRAFQSTVATRLIDWAAEVLNASTNQPRLPHAIIVINAADSRTNSKEWDVDYATESLLKSADELRPSSADTERVMRLMRHWHLPEKPVRNMRDLLLCYYSSIRVIHVPDNEQYIKMEEQVGKLDSEIRAACQASHNSKKKARMRMNADELDELFQAAFEHFSKSLDSPFDMIEAARARTSIPRDFGGNIIKMAVSVGHTLQKPDDKPERRRLKSPRHPAEDRQMMSVHDIFTPLSLMVASCVFLECSRENWKGSPIEFFEKNFLDQCVRAVYVFYQEFWPCEYEFEGRGRCVNVQARHQKGHQLKGRQHPGQYETTVSCHDLTRDWIMRIRNWIADFQSYLEQQDINEEILVPQIHQLNLHKFYEQVEGSLSYISHCVCLCCLRELPEHPLQCGHVLCTRCMATYGDLESRLGLHPKQQGQVSLARCPLHSPNKKAFEVIEPRTISLKPECAGVRILCLDGGGIRGIVELEVLRQIEKYLGGKISIQSFFDLIVGTSTGGIIAAGIGLEDWRVDECIEHFMNLADKAFTHRRFGVHKLPILGKAGRKYRTKPFESVLQDLFGPEEYLFGGFQADPKRFKTRVALTSTTATGSTALVLANYNRPDDSPFTEFVRPDRAEQELKVWEAIRATTAAPGFFKPFVKNETGQGFVDGAVYHNNPAYVAFEESRLLWPDVRHCLPDIILSVGTGHNRGQTNRIDRNERAANRTRPPEVSRMPSPGPNGNGPGQPLKHQGSEMVRNVKVILARMSNVLNSQLIWDTFKRERTLTAPRHELESVKARFQRVDPFLGFEPPSLDDKSKMKSLRDVTMRTLEDDTYYRRKIRYVAHRLVASSFYFEKLSHSNLGDGYYEFDGRILCRFPNNTLQLSHLGSFLSNLQDSSQPKRARGALSFRIQEVGKPFKEMEITHEIVNKMAQDTLSIFDFDRICQRVSNKSSEVIISLVLWDSESGKDDIIPISGFPRKLITEKHPASGSRNTATDTPKVSAEAYWREIGTEVEGRRTQSPSTPWFPDGNDDYIMNALHILEKDEETTETEPPASPKRQIFGASNGVRGLNWILAGVATMRAASRSPIREEGDQARTDTEANRKTTPDINRPTSSDRPEETGPDSAESDVDESELNRTIQSRLKNARLLGQDEGDLVERQRALALSLLEGGYEPPYLEDEDDDEAGESAIEDPNASRGP